MYFKQGLNIKLKDKITRKKLMIGHMIAQKQVQEQIKDRKLKLIYHILTKEHLIKINWEADENEKKSTESCG